MAEEDLIFGKMRHMFGGIAPSNMIAFSVAANNGHARLTVTLPQDTVIDGQTLCSVGGAVIRRKTTDYPKDEFDGDFVADITTSGNVDDVSASVPGMDYYYAAFPYSTNDVYNRNKHNRALLKIEGIAITTTSLPDGAVGTPYNADINYTGTEPVTVTVDSGSLPPGTALD